MNGFEAICTAERRKGWFPQLSAEVSGWRCELACGVDVKPANEPRPVGYGPTAEAALADAIRRRGGAVAA